jgi:uncharacterized protein YxeA
MNNILIVIIIIIIITLFFIYNKNTTDLFNPTWIPDHDELY